MKVSPFSLFATSLILTLLAAPHRGWAMGNARTEAPEAPANDSIVSIADLTEIQRAFIHSSEQGKTLPGACAIEYVRREPITQEVPGFSFSVRTTQDLRRWVDAKAHRFEKTRDAAGNTHVIYERGETETRCLVACEETTYLRAIEMTYDSSGRILELMGREENLNLKTVSQSICRGGFDPIPTMKNDIQLSTDQSDVVKGAIKQLKDGKLKLAGDCQLKLVDFETIGGALGRFVFEAPKSSFASPQAVFYRFENAFSLKEESGLLAIEAAHVYARPEEGASAFYGYDKVRTRLEIDPSANSVRVRQDWFNGMSGLNEADAIEHQFTVCE